MCPRSCVSAVTPGRIDARSLVALPGLYNVLADPAAGSTFYFAEGYTGSGFQEYLCLGNPGASEAKASITYLYKDGSTKPGEVTIPANSRARPRET